MISRRSVIGSIAAVAAGLLGAKYGTTKDAAPAGMIYKFNAAKVDPGMRVYLPPHRPGEIFSLTIHGGCSAYEVHGDSGLLAVMDLRGHACLKAEFIAEKKWWVIVKEFKDDRGITTCVTTSVSGR